MVEVKCTDSLDFIIPDWSVPQNIKAVMTTRDGGFGSDQFGSLNIAKHVGDDELTVEKNRNLLSSELNLPSTPLWLNQVHSNKVISEVEYKDSIDADGLYTSEKGVVLAIMTADCLPVIFFDNDKKQIAAIHCGWRGLLSGIIENTITKLSVKLENISVWMGVAIGPQNFEVGGEVLELFAKKNKKLENCFVQKSGDKWLADIYQIARTLLLDNGITKIFGGKGCSFEGKDKFFSYRRDGETGRMATLIWME